MTVNYITILLTIEEHYHLNGKVYINKWINPLNTPFCIVKQEIKFDENNGLKMDQTWTQSDIKANCLLINPDSSSEHFLFQLSFISQSNWRSILIDTFSDSLEIVILFILQSSVFKW